MSTLCVSLKTLKKAGHQNFLILLREPSNCEDILWEEKSIHFQGSFWLKLAMNMIVLALGYVVRSLFQPEFHHTQVAQF